MGAAKNEKFLPSSKTGQQNATIQQQTPLNISVLEDFGDFGIGLVTLPPVLPSQAGTVWGHISCPHASQDQAALALSLSQAVALPGQDAMPFKGSQAITSPLSGADTWFGLKEIFQAQGSVPYTHNNNSLDECDAMAFESLYQTIPPEYPTQGLTGLDFTAAPLPTLNSLKRVSLQPQSYSMNGHVPPYNDHSPRPASDAFPDSYSTAHSSQQQLQQQQFQPEKSSLDDSSRSTLLTSPNCQAGSQDLMKILMAHSPTSVTTSPSLALDSSSSISGSTSTADKTSKARKGKKAKNTIMEGGKRRERGRPKNMNPETHCCFHPSCDGRIFSRKGNLLVHMRTHLSNVVRHVCPQPRCGKSYNSKGSLTKHQNKHLLEHERPYPCEEPGCGNRLATLDNLKNHYRRLHPTRKAPTYCRGQAPAARVLTTL